MNAEMFEGIGISRMQTVLKDMEREGTIGWAMEDNSSWDAHYYLVSHRKADPQMSVNWLNSEYEQGKQSHYRENKKGA